MKWQARTVSILALIALVVAVLRYFMKGWVEPLGVSERAGSLIASITVVLLVSLIIIFAREGRATEGRYLYAAAWFVLLTAWCEILVIAGILITARTGAVTYYQETMARPGSAPPLPTTHALSHAVAFFPLAIIGSALGGIVYWVAKTGRRANPAPAK